MRGDGKLFLFFVIDFITGWLTKVKIFKTYHTFFFLFFKTLQTLISQEDGFDFPRTVKETRAGSAAKSSGVTL